jgi:hypothetical protein
MRKQEEEKERGKKEREREREKKERKERGRERGRERERKKERERERERKRESKRRSLTRQLMNFHKVSSNALSDTESSSRIETVVQISFAERCPSKSESMSRWKTGECECEKDHNIKKTT